MRIEHLAIWADNIELLRNFYMKYFDMQSNDHLFIRNSTTDRVSNVITIL